ncbi:MAG TPA: hypothetical protein VFY17_01895 [Pilimelia sp.]|nr:hypothetical protein [Pilimelia sp.]
MNVVLLAVGGNRRAAVTTEAATAAGSGGRVLVVVDQPVPWLEPADGVRVVALRTLLRPGAWHRLSAAVLVRAPRAVLRRGLGRGPLRRPVGRLAGAYEKRLGAPLHRRLTARAAGADPRVPALAALLQRERPDAVVPTDPASIALAEAALRRAGSRPPVVAYSILHLTPFARGGA